MVDDHLDTSTDLHFLQFIAISHALSCDPRVHAICSVIPHSCAHCCEDSTNLSNDGLASGRIDSPEEIDRWSRRITTSALCEQHHSSCKEARPLVVARGSYCFANFHRNDRYAVASTLDLVNRSSDLANHLNGTLVGHLCEMTFK